MNRKIHVMLLLCGALLVTGCRQAVKSISDLMVLRGALQKEFKEENINVTVHNGEALAISFVNSPFNGLHEIDQADKAYQIAKFAKTSHARMGQVKRIGVTFVERQTYLFVFHSSRSVGSYAYDVDELVDAQPRLPPLSAGKPAAALYDSAKGETLVYVQDMLQLYGIPQDGLMLAPHFSVKGRSIKRPAAVDFDFRSSSREEVFGSNRKLTVYVNDKAVFTGEPQITHSRRELDGTWGENLTQQIEYGKFAQMVGGDRVRMTLGAKQIELTAEQLTALRELKKCVDDGNCR